MFYPFLSQSSLRSRDFYAHADGIHTTEFSWTAFGGRGYLQVSLLYAVYYYERGMAATVYITMEQQETHQEMR